MILIDFSATVYQSMYSAIAVTKPAEINGKYRTADFAPYMVCRTLENIFEMQERFSNCGDVVLCLDGDGSKNWRKKIYPMYKASRPIQRKESPINFNEVFEVTDSLVDTLANNSPYKVVKVPEAEGDDVIMVLAKDLPGPTTIVSSDKDIIQMQKYPGIQQYSCMTQKFVTYETKHEDSMQGWLLEHVVLGDATDDVPRIVDGLKFTESFKQFMAANGIDADEMTVRNGDWTMWGFTEHRPNTTMLDIFERPRFFISTARKLIKEYGGLDAWLDSDPRLRQNYEMNKQLVLEEGIPDSVRNDISTAYQEAKTNVNVKKFEEFLSNSGVPSTALTLPRNFKKTFTVEDLF